MRYLSLVAMGRVLLGTTFLILAPVAFAQDAEAPGARLPEARPSGTIFSPLDLPAPNNMRNGAGAPGPDYWQQQVDYDIEVSLEPETRLVQGKAQITYTNNSPDTLNYLWMSLEQNAFRENSLATAVGEASAIGMKESEGDGYTIHGVESNGQALEFFEYDTLGRVNPPQPIAPGETFVFDIAWDFVIPKNVFRRFGIREFDQGKVYEVAQWFPAVTVYDDVHGWNTLPYLGTGEFYTNFGTYHVAITVPREMIVVCTGVLTNPEEVFTPEQVERLEQAKTSKETVMIRSAEEVADPASRPAGEGPLTWHFHAEKVRTVAWAASKAFIHDAAGTDGILVQSVYAKEGQRIWKDSTAMLRTAIEGYNKMWFPYPYPVAINVQGAEGGMEYPMILFCRARSERGLYGVTTHEIGHNWFPMLVNTDERRHAWMDEGFNTFMNGYSTPDWFGEGPNENDPGAFAMFLQMVSDVPIVTPADMLNGMQLGLLQYQKTGVGLTLLRESILGPERFDAAFREYIERWAFKSPRPADFFRTMEDASGTDLAWFWRGWFLEATLLDQAISGVSSPRRNRGPRVRLDNLGEMVMPVELRVTYEDGTVEDHKLPVEVWYQTNRIIHELSRDHGSVVQVEIDADRHFPDVDTSNNSWKADDDS